MVISLFLIAVELSEEELDVVEDVAIRSISWLGRSLTGENALDASLSERTISLSASFIMAVFPIDAVCVGWLILAGRNNIEHVNLGRCCF